MRDAIAEIEHEQWAHWTKYMLDNLTPENIARWRKQIDTPYSELSEKEKESDRTWANKVLDLPAEGWVHDHTEACSQHCEHKPECESESGCFVFNGCKRTPTLREVLDGKGVRV